MNDTPHQLDTARADSARGKSAIGLSDVHLTLDGPAGEVNILRGISLDVPAGEALGVVGPSGSGKTTMARRLAETNGLGWLSLDDIAWASENGTPVRLPIDECEPLIAEFAKHLLSSAAGSPWLSAPRRWSPPRHPASPLTWSLHR